MFHTFCIKLLKIHPIALSIAKSLSDLAILSSIRLLHEHSSPVILHSSRSDGFSLGYWFIIPFCAAFGTGIVRVMGLWNLRRRGSTVTMGLQATRLPNILEMRSGLTGWA